MALEKFFKAGNKLVVGGSTAYWPQNCNDVDFALFSPDGKPSKHIDVKGLKRFFKSKFPYANRDSLDGHSPKGSSFSRPPMQRCNPPYNISSLPRHNSDIDHYFLIGKFSPNRYFVDEHYRNIFCFKPELRVWLRIDRDFRRYKGSHLYKKPHKTLAMMLSAAENLPGVDLKPLIDYYWDELNGRRWNQDSNGDMAVARNLYDTFVKDAKLNLPIGSVLRFIEKYYEMRFKQGS